MNKYIVKFFDLRTKNWRTRDFTHISLAKMFISKKQCLIKLLEDGEEIYFGPARKYE